MMNLIKLELRKNKISTYLLASLLVFLSGFGFCFLFGILPQIEAISGDSIAPVDLAMFTDWSIFTTLISILFSMSFAIISAVMHTKFTVEEYTGKRAILMFSYPQSRSKILFAKCSLVFVFTAITSFICNTLAILVFTLISNAFGILPDQFEPSMLSGLLSIVGVCSLLAASVGLIAMRVGFWKKSLVATIVAAVILIAPFGNIISFFPQYSSTIHLIGMGVLLVVGFFIFLGLLLKVNKMEAL